VEPIGDIGESDDRRVLAPAVLPEGEREMAAVHRVVRAVIESVGS
jgi:hypothetical protein